jgi:hypothetical protein
LGLHHRLLHRLGGGQHDCHPAAHQKQRSERAEDSYGRGALLDEGRNAGLCAGFLEANQIHIPDVVSIEEGVARAGQQIHDGADGLKILVGSVEADGILGNVKKNDLPEFQQKLRRLSIGKKDRLFLFMLCECCMEISTVPLAIQKRIVQPPKFELVG